MYPILYQFSYFGELRSITTYSLFALLGIFVGALLILRLGHRRGIQSFDMVNIIAILVAMGFLISFLVHFLLFLPERLAMRSFFDLPIGIVSWGGVLGGFFAALCLARLWHISILSLGDIAMPGVALGFAIGRIGCHFAGCCFGLHYEGPLHLNFTHLSAPAATVPQPLFPIQLLSALLLFILCLILLRIFLLSVRPGYVIASYALLYSVGRFVIEFFRNDSRRLFAGLSDAQWYSLVLFITGAVLFFYLRRSKEAYGH